LTAGHNNRTTTKTTICKQTRTTNNNIQITKPYKTKPHNQQRQTKKTKNKTTKNKQQKRTNKQQKQQQ